MFINKLARRASIETGIHIMVLQIDNTSLFATTLDTGGARSKPPKAKFVPSANPNPFSKYSLIHKHIHTLSHAQHDTKNTTLYRAHKYS